MPSPDMRVTLYSLWGPETARRLLGDQRVGTGAKNACARGTKAKTKNFMTRLRGKIDSKRFPIRSLLEIQFQIDESCCPALGAYLKIADYDFTHLYKLVNLRRHVPVLAVRCQQQHAQGPSSEGDPAALSKH